MSEYRDDVREFGREARWTIWKTVGYIILPLIGVTALVGVLSHGLGWCGEAAEVAQETYGPRAAVRKYEWFKQTYESIQSFDRRIVVAQKASDDFKKVDMGGTPRSEWAYDDRQEAGRLGAVVQGLRHRRAEVVADYNAQAKMVTREQFRSDELPLEISLLPTP